MAQGLRAPVVEDWGLVPDTHMVAHNLLELCRQFFLPPRVAHTCARGAHAQTQSKQQFVQKQNKLIFNMLKVNYIQYLLKDRSQT